MFMDVVNSGLSSRKYRKWLESLTVACPCFFLFLLLLYFSSPEPKAHGELIVYRSIRRPSVRKHFQTRISPQPVGQL